MRAHPILLQKKYARIIELFATDQGLSMADALDFFYSSDLYPLISNGVADMHCMSDGYLSDELKMEYESKHKNK